MKIRHLLVMAVASAAVASASAFEWNPVVQQPNPLSDVTQQYQLETLRIAADMGLEATDVMPIWIDEDNNEIVGAYSSFSDPSWGDYIYDFNFADFKSNGEYTLKFPEGMLKNAAGELSDAKEFYYTVQIEALAPAMFEDFKVLSVSPDLSQPQAVWNDQVVKVNTNHNDAIGYVEIKAVDRTTGEFLFSTSNFTVGRQLGDSSEIAFEVVGQYKFFEGHEYNIEFIFYNGTDVVSQEGVPSKIVDRASYSFTGRVEAFKYSDITLDGVEPAPGFFTISEPDQAVFTFLFSGPVDITKVVTPLGQNGQVDYPESCLSSNEGKTLWTLNISDQEYLKSVQTELTLAVYAQDLNGTPLHGPVGEEEQAHYEFNWQCEVGAKPLVIVSPVSGSTIESLTEVVVRSADGESMMWSWNGEAKIVDQYDMVIGTLVYEEPAEGEDAAATEFHFTRMIDDFFNAVPLSNLAEGFYTIMFDPGCFNFGEQFDDAKSRSVTSTFTISANTQEGLEYIGVVPDSGEPVKILDKILVTFGEPVGFEEDYFVVNVYNANQELVTTAKARMDFMDPTMLVIILDEPVTEAGRYMVIIPAGQIFNGDYYESEGQAGLVNPMYRLFFVVDDDSEKPGVDPVEQEVFNYTEVSPANGSMVTELSHIELLFPELVGTMNDVAYVYKADALEDAPVANAKVTYSWEVDEQINVDLDDPIKTAGEYVVVIPARTICTDPFFMSDGKEGICNPEIRLTYIVDPDGTAVASVTAEKTGIVYDVNGRIVLRGACASDIKKLEKGIYIVGGRKIVVR